MPCPAPPIPPALLRRRLLAWYARHGRRLPWRAAAGEPPDAYRVWVSEIMLQQTRVAAVIPYYERFLRRFPGVEALAAADEAAVLALWSGLGYYRRARQLHAAARAIVARHGGRFPAEEAAARALPGIGEYTAGAILSIAYGSPLPAVDGNGVRIARRLTGRALSLPEARQLWTGWLAPRRPAAFNQAVMDLGATVCLPRAPQCGLCPLHRWCHSRGEGPQLPSRPSHAVVRHYALCTRGGRIWLRQRPAAAAQMPGLWEMPELAAAPAQAPLACFRHAITTSRITAIVYRSPAPPNPEARWISRRELSTLALTGLTRKILRRLYAKGGGE